MSMLSKILFGAVLAAASLWAQPKPVETPKAPTTQATTPKKPPVTAKTVPAAERCIGKTADGDQCKRRAASGKKYCWQHDPNRKKKATVAKPAAPAK